MTLEEAIAEVEVTAGLGEWNTPSEAVATILNAAATGDLIPASDARLAVAETLRKAGEEIAIRRRAWAAVSWENAPDRNDRAGGITYGRLQGCDVIAEAIGEIVNQDALAEVQALKAERDELRDRVRTLSWMGEGYALVQARAEAAEAEVARLRGAQRDQIEARVEAVNRRNFVAPEDAAVEAICLRFGYGAVMDAASRLWARTDMLGAFYIGGCIGFRTEEEARATLEETKP